MFYRAAVAFLSMEVQAVLWVPREYDSKFRARAQMATTEHMGVCLEQRETH